MNANFDDGMKDKIVREDFKVLMKYCSFLITVSLITIRKCRGSENLFNHTRATDIIIRSKIKREAVESVGASK